MRAGVEQFGIARLDRRQQRLAGLDRVARLHVDPQQPTDERRRDDVLLANPRLAVLVDGHLQRPALDRRQIDLRPAPAKTHTPTRRRPIAAISTTNNLLPIFRIIDSTTH